MAVRKTIQIGHAALKAANKSISNFESQKLKQMIRDLKDTMKDQSLIGMAVPQIAENYKVFITQPRKTKARNLAKSDKLRVYINPKITEYSKAKSIIYEGCGSVLDGQLFGPVKRSQQISIEAFDEHKTHFRLTCDGILARVILHEYDHLEGIEFTEKVDDYKKLMTDDYYIKNIKNLTSHLRASKITLLKYKKLS